MPYENYINLTRINTITILVFYFRSDTVVSIDRTSILYTQHHDAHQLAKLYPRRYIDVDMTVGSLVNNLFKLSTFYWHLFPCSM